MPSPFDMFGFGGGILSGVVSGALRGAGVRGTSGYRRPRRRRARLSARDLHELTTITSLFGKTAAAKALPYYMEGGR